MLASASTHRTTTILAYAASAVILTGFAVVYFAASNKAHWIQSNDNSSGAVPNVNPEQHHSREVQSTPSKLQVPIPAFVVVFEGDAFNRTLSETVGSIHYYHPRSPIVIYTAKSGGEKRDGNGVSEAYARLIARLHAWPRVHHLSRETLAAAFPSIDRDAAYLLAMQTTAEKFGSCIFIPSGFYVTSSLDDINREIHENGFVSKTSTTAPDTRIFGYSKGSIMFHKVSEIAKVCSKGCAEPESSSLKKIWTELNSGGTRSIVLPLTKVDKSRNFYSEFLQDVTSPRNKEITLGGRNRDPTIHVSPKPRTTTNRMTHSQSQKPKKTRVAMLVPSTSKGSSSVENLPIYDALLASMKSTITEAEKNTHEFIVYLGYDEGDPLYDNPRNMESFRRSVQAVLVGYPISLKAYKLKGFGGAPCWIWNALFKIAYEDNCDYFYQINDDVQIQDSGWLSDFIHALRSNPVMENLGVSAPLDIGNRKTMTQSFVHRTHYEIFKSYYPESFRNWYSDDWMTHIYGKGSSFVFPGHIIRNLNNRGQRYREDNSHRALVAPELKNGCDKIHSYFKQKARNPSDFICNHRKLYWENPNQRRRR